MSAKTNLTLDLTIFTVFLVVSAPHFTGETIHEWLALAFLAALVTHLLFHWKWIVRVTKEFFKKFFHTSRLNYVVNLLFFIAMTVTMLSGLMISRSVMSTLGIQLNANHSWESIHRVAADLSVTALGLHFALHFKWLVSHLNKFFVRPIARQFRRKEREIGALPNTAAANKH